MSRLVLPTLTRLAGGSNTSITVSYNFTSNPSMLRPVFNDIPSASVRLFDTAVCALHAHEIFTNV